MDDVIAKAFNKGMLAAKSNCLAGQMIRNPYTVTGSGKKLKAAWHNGYRSVITDSENN